MTDYRLTKKLPLSFLRAETKGVLLLSCRGVGESTIESCGERLCHRGSEPWNLGTGRPEKPFGF